jgi:hypothetical protein
MSQFDDESEDSDEFDLPGEEDALIRELRAEIVRLEAQLDQLAAGARERNEEAAAIAVRVAELEAAVGRLRARQRRDARLLLVAWAVAVFSLGLSLYTYLTQ